MRSVPTVTGASATTVCADVDLLKNRAVASTPLGIGPNQFCPFSQLPDALVTHSVRPVSVPLKAMSAICMLLLPGFGLRGVVPVKTTLYELYAVELVTVMR